MAQDVLELLDHLQWPVYNIVGVCTLIKTKIFYPNLNGLAIQQWEE